MNLYLPDTHAIYWYEFGNPRLSVNARQTFEEAESGNAILVIHPIVLAEFRWLLKKADPSFNYGAYLKFLQSNPIYRYEPVTFDDLVHIDDFDDIPEMHDRLIAVTAHRLGATVVSRDPMIQRSLNVQTLW